MAIPIKVLADFMYQNEWESLKSPSPKKLQRMFDLPQAPLKLRDCESEEILEQPDEDKPFDIKEGRRYQVLLSSPSNDGGWEKFADESNIQKALICCLTNYPDEDSDCKGWVQNHFQGLLKHHDFKSVCPAMYGDTKYVIAITEEEHVYIGFRGTSNFQDVLQDLKIVPELGRNFPGKYHSGFLKRAQNIPMDDLLRKFQGRRIILCGHSMGGAVASIVALHLLKQVARMGDQNTIISTITFGVPMYADKEVRKQVLRSEFQDRFLNIVLKDDPVPRLLRLAEAVSSITQNATNKVKKYSQQAKPILQDALGVLSKVPNAYVSGFATAGAIGLEALDTTLNKLDQLNMRMSISLQELNSTYVPIGWYSFWGQRGLFKKMVTSVKPKGAHEGSKWETWYLSNPDDIGKLLSDTPALSKDSAQHHALVHYDSIFAEVFSKQEFDVMHSVTCLDEVDFSPRTVEIMDEFPLKLREDSISLLRVKTEGNNGGSTCSSKIQVKIVGENMGFFLLDNSAISGIPMKKQKDGSYWKVESQSSSQVVLTGEVDNTDGAGIPSVYQELKLCSQFNIVTQRVNWRNILKEIQGKTLADSLVADLHPNVLKRAWLQGVITVMFSKNREEGIANHRLLKHLYKLEKAATGKDESILLQETKLKVGQMLPGLSEDSAKAKEVFEKIIEYLGSPLEVEYPKRLSFYLWAATIGLVGVASVVASGGATLLYFGSFALTLTAVEAAAVAATAAAGLVSAGVGYWKLKYSLADIEKSYQSILRTCFEGLNPLQEPLEQELLNSIEISDTYKLEAALFEKCKTLGYLEKSPEELLPTSASENNGDVKSPFRKEKKFDEVTRKSKIDIMKRIQASCQMFQIRQYLKDTCVIGLVGLQDAGKTTLAKELWGLNVKDLGGLKHTDEATVYPLPALDNMMIVDFPGSTSIDEKMARVMNVCGAVSTFFILVIPYTGGDVSTTYTDEIKKILIFDLPFLLCVNKCGLYFNDKKSDTMATKEQVDELRENFLREIRNLPKQSKFKQSNLLFTDFHECTQPMRDIGLAGLPEVRNWLKTALITYSGFKEGEDRLQICTFDQSLYSLQWKNCLSFSSQ